MIKPFICGSGAFHHQLEEDDDQELRGSPCSSPRNKPRKKDKNPYANRGLDKFSALLAELEDKRQKIYTEMGSDEISFVRFQFSNSDEVKPIVVKVRDHKQQKEKNNDHTTTTAYHHDDKDKYKVESQTNEVLEKSRNELGDDQKTEKKEKSCSWNNFPKIMDMWKPSYYLPAAMILILLFLAVFGRSFAIICTSIGWYLVPTIKGSGSSNQVKIKPGKKKEYLRRASERKIVYGGSSSPTSVITGPANEFSPRQRGHRKSF